MISKSGVHSKCLLTTYELIFVIINSPKSEMAVAVTYGHADNQYSILKFRGQSVGICGTKMGPPPSYNISGIITVYRTAALSQKSALGANLGSK
jgi:hypothetical protein